MRETVLVRYGTIPEVARFETTLSEPLERGCSLVVRSHRGIEVGTFLEQVNGRNNGHADNGHVQNGYDHNGQEQEPAPEGGSDFVVLRRATPEDASRLAELRAECEAEFDTWCRRIGEWNLQLELIDLEWTLDRRKLVLYVLNDRGPDCTKLALQAAAAGLGLVEVQPVNADGLMQPEASGGGCGSGGG